MLVNTFHPAADYDDTFEMWKNNPAKPSNYDEAFKTKVRTCAEWLRALKEGFETTYFYSKNHEPLFKQASAMFTGIPAMRASHQSGFENEHGPLDLTRLAREILAPVQASPADLSLAIKITTSVQEKAERAAKDARCSKRRDEFKIDLDIF